MYFLIHFLLWALAIFLAKLILRFGRESIVEMRASFNVK